MRGCSMAHAQVLRPYRRSILRRTLAIQAYRSHVGLTPGQIGLYQLNVAIPQSFTPTRSCGDPIDGETIRIAANAVLHITTLYGGTQELGFCWKA